MSRIDNPHAYLSTTSRSNSSVRPDKACFTSLAHGAAVPVTCGTAYSTIPSAVFSRPRRLPLR